MRVLLAPALVRLFPGCADELEIEAESVGALVAALDRRYPGMADRLCDGSPAIRRHIAVFVEGRRAGLDTGLEGVSEVAILTAISGG